MKKLTMLATALLLTGLLAAPVMAGDEGSNPPQQPPAQSQQTAPGQQVDKGQPESQGRTLHRAYFQKREAMKKYRDEMLKVRTQAVQSEE